MASWLIVVIVTAVGGTGLVLLLDRKSADSVTSLPGRMVNRPFDFFLEYFLALLTGFVVGATYDMNPAWLTVMVATHVAGSVFMVVEAIWVEGGIRYAGIFLRDLLTEGWPLVILHYGIVFAMAWVYVGAFHWLA